MTGETGETGDKSSLAEPYMDVAIPIRRGGESYIIYILDNKTTATQLTDQLVVLIIESLVFGLLIALVHVLTKGKAPAKKSFSCEGCPNAGNCHSAACSEKGAEN